VSSDTIPEVPYRDTRAIAGSVRDVISDFVHLVR
jgi:hypothetical protein